MKKIPNKKQKVHNVVIFNMVKLNKNEQMFAFSIKKWRWVLDKMKKRVIMGEPTAKDGQKSEVIIWKTMQK